MKTKNLNLCRKSKFIFINRSFIHAKASVQTDNTTNTATVTTIPTMSFNCKIN